MTALTEERKLHIKSSWSSVNDDVDLAGNGVEFLVKLFTDFPEYMTFFPAFDGKTPEEIRSSPKAKMHGKVLMTTLDKIVANLDDLETVIASLHRVVGSHFPRGVTASHFKATLECFGSFLAVQLGDAFNNDVKDAWGVAVQILASVMEAEYNRLKAEQG